jgi:hypothetical protein
MTVEFYTGPRITSSVIHQCVRAAVKGLGFGVVIVAGTRMSRLRKPERVIFFGLTLLLQGCLLGPDFKTPLARVADKWFEQNNKSVDSSASEHRDWWAVFNDPRLTRLIQLAYQQNLTLRAAGVRVLEARARLGIAIGEFYPQQQQLGASLTYNRIPISLPVTL